MELNIHYFNRYLELAAYYQNNPPNANKVYCERHHIIFRSWINDINSCWSSELLADKNNLVLVPYKAHVILHELAYKAYACNRNAFAYHAVCKVTVSRPEIKTRHIINSRLASKKALLSNKSERELIKASPRPIINTNKNRQALADKSIKIDLKHSIARELLTDLVAECVSEESFELVKKEVYNHKLFKKLKQEFNKESAKDERWFWQECMKDYFGFTCESFGKGRSKYRVTYS